MLSKYLNERKSRERSGGYLTEHNILLEKEIYCLWSCCHLAHLTYPSCDFISLIYKMGANYMPCNIAKRIKWRHCEKVLVPVQMLCKRKLQHINYV